MQTRTSGVMHQYPLRIASGFQTCQYRIGTLITAIYNGDLRMIRQRKLCKTAIARTYGNDDTCHPGMRQQRMHRVFKNGLITD